MHKPNPRQPHTMTVAGVMSGTSADGVDVALCRVAMGKDGVPTVKLLGHRSFRYSSGVRAAVLACAGGQQLSAAAMAGLSWRLGAVYAECVAKTVDQLGTPIHLVACHGQTVVHQAAALASTKRAARFTWQMGEPAVIAERLHLPVVSDLRPADLAAGGQGAPLVPMLDWCLFRHAVKDRLLLNLGGIANITALPAGCTPEAVLAFDTGPANMVIDAVMQRLYGKGFDKGGAAALRGSALPKVLATLLRHSYFSAPPPKSCGREQYGVAFVDRLLSMCKGAPAGDIVATATALTVDTVAHACLSLCQPHLRQHSTLANSIDLLVSGGGARNAALMNGIAAKLAPFNVKVATTQAAGLPVQAKEAAAFALLGWLTWHGLPGNIPSATGASRPVVLGKVTYV